MPQRRRAGLEAMGRDDALGFLADRFSEAAARPNANRITLLPAQELFFARAKHNGILFGGNQAGKTFTGVYEDCMILMRKHPYRQHLYPDEGPLRLRFIGVDFDRGIEQGAIPNFQQIMPPSMLINGNWADSYSNASHMLTLVDKSTVSFMSYEQDPNKFQIVQLHHIHFDEEPPKPIFDESMPRLVRYNGTWVITETPVQQLEWIQDELMEPADQGLRPDIGIYYINTGDNTYLTPEAKQQLFNAISVEDRIVRLHGGYKSGSLVFPEFTTHFPNIISADWLPRGDGWSIYESMDHGYQHAAVWLWTAVHLDGSIVTFRCLYAKGVRVEQWADAVHQMRAQIRQQIGKSDWEPAGTFGDPAIGWAKSGETGRTIQQAYGLHNVHIGTEGITKARAGNQNFGLDKMHEYLAPRPLAHSLGYPMPPSASTGGRGEPWWQITENCGPLILEMKKARKLKQTLKAAETKNVPEGIRDKDNDTIDAIKYLFMITHDLRPSPDAPLRFSPDLPDEFRNASKPPPVYARDISPYGVGYEPSEPWVSGSNYQELEG